MRAPSQPDAERLSPRRSENADKPQPQHQPKVGQNLGKAPFCRFQEVPQDDLDHLLAVEGAEGAGQQEQGEQKQPDQIGPAKRPKPLQVDPAVGAGGAGAAYEGRPTAGAVALLEPRLEGDGPAGDLGLHPAGDLVEAVSMAKREADQQTGTPVGVGDQSAAPDIAFAPKRPAGRPGDLLPAVARQKDAPLRRKHGKAVAEAAVPVQVVGRGVKDFLVGSQRSGGPLCRRRFKPQVHPPRLLFWNQR